jgi:hypothetical protein
VAKVIGKDELSDIAVLKIEATGLPAVTLATLLVGLLWPYLFGFLGHGVGIWVVLAGAILLLAGGLLDLRAGRHHDPGSTV